MKLSVISCIGTLTLSLGCSAGSGAGSENGSGNGNQGASSSTGATSSTGAMPNLGTGGTLGMLGGGMPNEPDVINGECAQQDFMVSSKPADVLLVLDRSASMIENYVPPNNASRWDAVVPAVTAVIAATDATVSWGLKLFPEGEGAECVAESVTDAIPAEIMPSNAATVNGIITSTMATGNGTPTGEAIKRATAYLTGRGASNQYILLATDGDPSCPDGDDAAEQYAYTQISAAYAAGFPVYVIGVLDPVKDKSKFAILNQMAQLGGTSRSDNPVADKFYHANSEAELTAALDAVTGHVASCVFEFDSKPPDETNIAVKINGEKVAQDPNRAEGWEYTDDQYMGLELFGAACQAVKDATLNHVEVTFGCKGQPIK